VAAPGCDVTAGRCQVVAVLVVVAMATMWSTTAQAETLEGSAPTAIGATVGALAGAAVGVGLVLGTADRVLATEAQPGLVWTAIIIGSTSTGVALGAMSGGVISGDPLTGLLAGVGAGLITATVSTTLALVGGTIMFGATALLLAIPGFGEVRDGVLPILTGPLVASMQALSLTPMAVGSVSASVLECAVARRCDGAARMVGGRIFGPEPRTPPALSAAAVDDPHSDPHDASAPHSDPHRVHGVSVW